MINPYPKITPQEKKQEIRLLKTEIKKLEKQLKPLKEAIKYLLK